MARLTTLPKALPSTLIKPGKRYQMYYPERELAAIGVRYSFHVVQCVPHLHNHGKLNFKYMDTGKFAQEGWGIPLIRYLCL